MKITAGLTIAILYEMDLTANRDLENFPEVLNSNIPLREDSELYFTAETRRTKSHSIFYPRNEHHPESREFRRVIESYPFQSV